MCVSSVAFDNDLMTHHLKAGHEGGFSLLWSIVKGLTPPENKQLNIAYHIFTYQNFF